MARPEIEHRCSASVSNAPASRKSLSGQLSDAMKTQHSFHFSLLTLSSFLFPLRIDPHKLIYMNKDNNLKPHQKSKSTIALLKQPCCTASAKQGKFRLDIELFRNDHVPSVSKLSDAPRSSWGPLGCPRDPQLPVPIPVLPFARSPLQENEQFFSFLGKNILIKGCRMAGALQNITDKCQGLGGTQSVKEDELFSSRAAK